MATESPGRTPSDELPQALDAFVTRRPWPEASITCAATLLTLTPEPWTDFLVEETRQELNIPAVRTVDDLDEVAYRLMERTGLGSIAGQSFSEPRDEMAYRRVVESLPNEEALSDTGFEPDPELISQQAFFAEAFLPQGSEESDRDSAASLAATRLAALSMLDPVPLVRVAGAAAVVRVDRENPLANLILADALRNGRDGLSLLAATVIARARGRRYRRVVIESDKANPPGRPDSVVVHGTWARRRGSWWRPDGIFNRFLRKERVFPKLYCGVDPFEWSGYYHWRTRIPGTSIDWNRDQAAGSLAWWTHRELSEPPDVIGHSYGASISMRMTGLKKRVRGLVLLSPAVHETCLPDSTNYKGALVVRMKHDLVLLADRSRLELLFDLPNVEMKVLDGGGWLRHSRTHDPRAWRGNKLDLYVRDEWLPKL
jgi:hypothetical protein